VSILWQKLARVRRERILIGHDIPLPKRTLRQVLEVIGIDPDTLRVERDHRVRERQVGGARPRQQLPLERAARGTGRFAKTVERRLEPGIRPKDLYDLLPMEAVIGMCRQELGEGLRSTPLPVRDW